LHVMQPRTLLQLYWCVLCTCHRVVSVHNHAPDLPLILQFLSDSLAVFGSHPITESLLAPTVRTLTPHLPILSTPRLCSGATSCIPCPPGTYFNSYGTSIIYTVVGPGRSIIETGPDFLVTLKTQLSRLAEGHLHDKDIEDESP
jgi:hypothetical protein